jgi:hypothetical protein
MLDISKLRLTQPSLVGSWAELGKKNKPTHSSAPRGSPQLKAGLPKKTIKKGKFV